MIIKSCWHILEEIEVSKMKNEHENNSDMKRNRIFLIVGVIVIMILLLVFSWQSRDTNNDSDNQNTANESSSLEESTNESASTSEEVDTNELTGTGEDVTSPLLIDNFMGTFEGFPVGEIANDDMGGSSKEEWVEVFGEPSRAAYNEDNQEVVVYTWTNPVQEAENSVLTVRFIDDMAVSKSVIGLSSEGTDIANTSVFERISLEGNYNYRLSKQDLGQPDGITESKTDGKNIRTVSWIAKSGDGQGANMTIIFEDGIAVEKSDSGLM